MTEADRETLMTAFTELSNELFNLQDQEIAGTPHEVRQFEKEHLLRCAFFADMLEDME